MIIKEIPADYMAGKTESEIRAEIQKMLAVIRDRQQNHDRENLVRMMRQGECRKSVYIHQYER